MLTQNVTLGHSAQFYDLIYPGFFMARNLDGGFFLSGFWEFCLYFL